MLANPDQPTCPNCRYYLPFNIGTCPYCGVDLITEPRDWRLKERIGTVPGAISGAIKWLIRAVEKLLTDLLWFALLAIGYLFAGIFTFLCIVLLFPALIYSTLWFVRNWANDKDTKMSLAYMLSAITGGIWCNPHRTERRYIGSGTDDYVKEKISLINEESLFWSSGITWIVTVVLFGIFIL